jgi:hypothetical protein
MSHQHSTISGSINDTLVSFVDLETELVIPLRCLMLRQG